MQNIRRGTGGPGPSADRASGALIDSRNGRAITTADPRRKRRREIGRRRDANGATDSVPDCRLIADPSSLVPERVALDDRVDEAADAVVARLRRVEDRLDRLAIGEPRRRAGG